MAIEAIRDQGRFHKDLSVRILLNLLLTKIIKFTGQYLPAVEMSLSPYSYDLINSLFGANLHSKVNQV